MTSVALIGATGGFRPGHDHPLEDAKGVGQISCEGPDVSRPCRC